MSNEQLQVGDRVELLDLFIYTEDRDEGLVAGNTGTVTGFSVPFVRVRTNNALSEDHATAYGDVGWIYAPDSLRKLP